MYNVNYKYNLLDLRTRFSNEEIMLHFFGDFELGEKYKSPFRNEVDPSFVIFYDLYGRLMWRDFGKSTGQIMGDAIQYVRELYPDKSFLDITNYIYKSLLKSNIPKQRCEELRNTLVEKDIRIKVNSKWTERTHAYWKQYGIPIDVLEKYNVKPCSQQWANGVLKYEWSDSDPSFAYLYAKDSFKLYRPYAVDRKHKFKSKNINNVIQGLKQLPKTGTTVLITKSLKDIMVWDVLGIPSIAPNSESSFPPKEIIEDLKKRFENVIINFDNDETGIKFSKKFSSEHNLKEYFIPDKNSKDISDFVLSKPKNEWSLFQTLL
jgi:hypothetical protein